MTISPVAGLICLCLLCLDALALLWLPFTGRSDGAPTQIVPVFATFVVASFAGGMYFEWRNSCAVMKLLVDTPCQQHMAAGHI